MEEKWSGKQNALLDVRRIRDHIHYVPDTLAIRHVVSATNLVRSSQKSKAVREELVVDAVEVVDAVNVVEVVDVVAHYIKKLI